MKNSLRNWQGVTAVIGVDFGDSGKGRLVDDLAQRADIVARFNGGSNTGHTVINDFGKFAFHIMPSGIFNQKAQNIIGRYVVVDLESLIEDEFKQLAKAKVSWKNLLLDEQATLTMPWHKLKDGLREKYRHDKIGTTGRGVGPSYADRTERSALRIEDLLKSDFKKKLKAEVDFQNNFYNLNLNFSQILNKYLHFAKIIKPFVVQSVPIVKEALKKGKNILFEGAQGYFLDIDVGTYPYVTSSNTGIVGIWRSFDIQPSQINNVIGITKAYLTRVGAGPMPTKVSGDVRKVIIEKGNEVGSTTGRIRDPGWLDLVLIKYAIEANNIQHLAITKLDVLTGIKSIKICTAYRKNGKHVEYLPGDANYLDSCYPIYQELPGWQEDISKVNNIKSLPKNAQNFVKKIEEFTKTPINFIGVGPRRSEVIYV